MARGTSPLSEMRLLTMRLALPACRSQRQRTDAVIFICRVGFGLLQLVDGSTIYHMFLALLALWEVLIYVSLSL